MVAFSLYVQEVADAVKGVLSEETAAIVQSELDWKESAPARPNVSL